MKKLFLKKTIIISGIILAAFLFFGANFAEAASICNFKGPDLSQDFLRLSGFSVSGNPSLKVGDTITVKFNLQNYGQTDLRLGTKGFFAAARDPNNLDTSFGFTRQSTTVKTGETIAVEASRVLDKAGTWKIWPSYQILAGNLYKLGPDDWHACVLNVGEAIIDSDQDRIPDNEDNCPNEAENYNQYQDDDGCPDVIVTPAPQAPLQPMPLSPYCGNRQCEKGENQTNCCTDCGCSAAGQVCVEGVCQTITAAPLPAAEGSFVGSSSEESYIVGFIYSMRVRDDKDPLGPGEMMTAAFSATGEKIQKTGWPAQMWLPVNSGSTINQSIPLFAFKESEMGDNLAISITAVDNDAWPSWLSWLEGLVGFLADLIDRVWSLVLTVLNSVATSIQELELQVAEVRSHLLHDLLVGNEEIGAINKIYTRAENWGIWGESGEPPMLEGGDLRTGIWIGRVTVPADRNYKYTVKVKNASFSDTGDYSNGEVWINLRAASNFDENGNLATVSRRVPDSGTWSGGDDSLLEGVRMFAPDGTEMDRMPLFSATDLKGPFIFLEANTWDEDNPGVGDDHDLIGEYSRVILFPDFDLPPVISETNYADRTDFPWVFGENTITMPFLTRENMRLQLEITRELETSY